MKKTLKKGFAVLLSVLMLVAFPVNLYADNTDGYITVTAVEPRNDEYYYDSESNILYVNSDKTAELYVEYNTENPPTFARSSDNLTVNSREAGDKLIELSISPNSKAPETTDVTIDYNVDGVRKSFKILVKKCVSGAFSLSYTTKTGTVTSKSRTTVPYEDDKQSEWVEISTGPNVDSLITSETVVSLALTPSGNDTYDYKIYSDRELKTIAPEAKCTVANQQTVGISIDNPQGGDYYLVCSAVSMAGKDEYGKGYITRKDKVYIKIHVSELITTEQIKLDVSEIVLYKDVEGKKTFNLTATDNPVLTKIPENANNELIYRTDNTNVATVDKTTRIVTAVGTGETTLRIYSRNNPSICVECPVKVKITMKSLDIGNISDVYKYTGSAIKPMPSVKYGGVTLTAGTDYTVTYENNVNIGTATVNIYGKGAYSEYIKKSITFEIVPVYATDYVTFYDSKKCYQLSPECPAPLPTLNVKNVNGKNLVLGTDYTLSAVNNTSAGIATATITFIGNYSGSATIDYTIRDYISNANVAKISDQYYTGKYITPAVKLTYNGSTLDPSNYSVSYSYNQEIGTATAKITGKDPYFTGTVTQTFKIRQLPGAKLSKVTSKKKQITVKWKKATTLTGYQVQYCTNKYFYNDCKTVNVKKSKTSTTIKKLTSGKKYYVRVRVYKTTKGVTAYSKWSSAKTIKVK